MSMIASVATGPTQGLEPKRRRGHLRVAAILTAATELFADKGFDATTMTEVAARSGTAMASLYRFFPSKEALADALLIRYAEHAQGELAALRARAQDISLEDLAAALADYNLAVQSQRRFALDLTERRGGIGAERRLKLRSAMREGLADILRLAIPGLSEKRAKAMAAIILKVFKGVATVQDEEDDVFRRQLVDETRMLIQSYLAAAAKSHMEPSRLGK